MFATNIVPESVPCGYFVVLPHALDIENLEKLG